MNKNIFFAMLAGAALVSCSNNDVLEDIPEQPVAIDFTGEPQSITRAEIADKADLSGANGFMVWGYKSKDAFATTPTTVFGGQQVTGTYAHYTAETAATFNAGLTGAIAAETTLTSDQATALNAVTGLSKTYSANETLLEADANKYNATLSDAVKAGDIIDGEWTYSPKKYWDKTTSYKFFAAAPYDATNISFNPNTGYTGTFTISNVSSGLASASKDYLIDRLVKNVGANQTSYSAVGFAFHHIMAKVDFKLAKASTLESTDVVKVQSIKMSGWNNSTATFAESSTLTAATWSTLDCSEWTPAASSTAGNVDVLNATETTLETTAASTNTLTYIMVPQDIASLKFTVTYTITDKNNNTETFSDQVATLSSQKWGTDSHTTYTLTIGPAAIEFTVNSICGFCNNATGTVTVQ